MKPKTYLLPLIIVSQFACTSLWFAGNIALQNLPLTTTTNTSLLDYVLSAVQLGFITDTLIFALFNIADRFSPSLVSWSISDSSQFSTMVAEAAATELIPFRLFYGHGCYQF